MMTKEVYEVHKSEANEAVRDELITKFNRTFVQAIYQLLASDDYITGGADEQDTFEDRIASRFVRLVGILMGDEPATIQEMENITTLLAVAHIAADKAAANASISVRGRAKA